MSRSLLLPKFFVPKFSPPTRLYLVKVCAPFSLVLIACFCSLLAECPAQAQGSGSWVAQPCDAQGKLTNAYPDNQGFYTMNGTESVQVQNTYPAPLIAAVLDGNYSNFQACSPLTSPPNGPIPGTVLYQGISGWATAANNELNGSGNFGSMYTYDVNQSYGSPNTGLLNGSITTTLSGQLFYYFKEVWQGYGAPTTPMPDHIDLLLKTTMTATADVGYGASTQTSGLSASATASDGSPFNETASASAGDAGNSSGVPIVVGHHLVKASVDAGTGIAEAYLNGTETASASDTIPYGTFSAESSMEDRPTNGATSAGSDSSAVAVVRQDSRDVEIASNLSTPDNPTYYTDPITHLKVANVRQPDGSMTDDIMTPPLTVSGLGASAGTSAAYSAVISGLWGSNSTYKWDSTLNPPTAFSNQPISGTFNSSGPLGNNTQTIPNFAGTYYNPPASDGKSDIVTLTITDGVDGAVAANTYTVRFHRPYPINYHQDGPGVDIGGGVLKFSYKWDSSTGNLADLSNIVIGETITYDGNPGTYTAGYPGGYTPVSPPYSGTHDNPTEVASSTIATVGRWQDQHRPIGFSATMPQTPGTYTYTGTQTYWYYDKSDSIKKTLAGPYAIVRSVTGALYPPVGPNNIRWGYTIGKAGSYASLNLGDYGP